MKKILTIAAIAMFSFAMVSCASDVDKAKKIVDKLIQAEMDGDYDKVEKYEKELNAMDLDEEEQAEVLKYATMKAFGVFN